MRHNKKNFLGFAGVCLLMINLSGGCVVNGTFCVNPFGCDDDPPPGDDSGTSGDSGDSGSGEPPDESADDTGTGGECLEEVQEEGFVLRSCADVPPDMCNLLGSFTPLTSCEVVPWDSADYQNVENKALVVPQVEDYEIVPSDDLDAWVKQPGAGWTDKWVRLWGDSYYTDESSAKLFWTAQDKEYWTWTWAQDTCEGWSSNAFIGLGEEPLPLLQAQTVEYQGMKILLSKYALPSAAGVAQSAEAGWFYSDSCDVILWVHNMEPDAVMGLIESTFPNASPVGPLNGIDLGQFWAAAGVSGSAIVTPVTPTAP